jgi:hypothetical protein
LFTFKSLEYRLTSRFLLFFQLVTQVKQNSPQASKAQPRRIHPGPARTPHSRGTRVAEPENVIAGLVNALSEATHLWEEEQLDNSEQSRAAEQQRRHPPTASRR